MHDAQPPRPRAFEWAAARLAQRRRLPHLEQARAIYFVTCRLADSVPQSRLRQWERDLDAWLRLNPPPRTPAQEEEFAELGYRRIERWLDQGLGHCLLADPAAQREVERCLRHEDGDRYWLGDFVIMPNHLHVLVCMNEGRDLLATVRTWRAVTTHRINRQLGRRGRLWQDEAFDHIVRNDDALARIQHYIHRNAASVPPGQAALGRGKLFSDSGNG